MHVGTFAHGQGHHTTFAQIAAETLGVAFERVSVIDGDTGQVHHAGTGTYGSRSVQVGGSAVRQACVDLVGRARELAADHFEAAVDDIAHGDDGFAVAGVPAKTVSWSSLADIAPHGAPHDARAGLSRPSTGNGPRRPSRSARTWRSWKSTAETGAVRLVEHVAVDDCGTIINPMLAEGQVHGGAAQGAAQALFEEIVIDDAGNVLTSNLADYCCVTAAELPSFTLGHTVTPTPVNPMGVKGIGESGTIRQATPAVQNAVIDTLAHLGVRHLEMPCTPERVWRALEGERYSGLRVDRRTLSPATTGGGHMTDISDRSARACRACSRRRSLRWVTISGRDTRTPSAESTHAGSGRARR